MPRAPADWFQLLASWSRELLSATDRIDYLIGSRHQPTKGGYREALLRQLLRRILPDRFRVSTGFVYRWGEEPSRQLDVLIWDAQQHTAVLEEGELAILTPESVAGIIEVKSILDRHALRDSLGLLSPPWLVNWRHRDEQSRTGLHQQVPDVPLRAVFAYTALSGDADACATVVFEELTGFYREMFGEDAEVALGHRGPRLRWLNLVDAICIADCLEVEQTSLTVDGSDCRLYDGPGFAAFPAESSAGNLAVGKFCMYLLFYLLSRCGDDASKVTFNEALPTAHPGVCCPARLALAPVRVRLWGNEVPPTHLWNADPPLWDQNPAAL